MVMNLVFLIVSILVNVAFITLMERKILGLSQSRVGPGKVGWGGVLQPGADAIKLFSKKWELPFKSSRLLFVIGPTVALFLMLWLGLSMAVYGSLPPKCLSSLLFLVVVSLNVYPLVYAGWASNSKLAMIGALRGIAQTISYEISLALILFYLLMLGPSPDMGVLGCLGMKTSVLIVAAPSFLLWFITCVAETNRTPFDFSEGESELVSGFNVEYGGGGFAIIFMAEYGFIYLLSILTSFMFLAEGHSSSLMVGGVLVIFAWIWLRSAYPRYRYDKLMGLCWKFVLPSSLLLLFKVVFCSGGALGNKLIKLFAF